MITLNARLSVRLMKALVIVKIYAWKGFLKENTFKKLPKVKRDKSEKVY